VLRDLLVRVIEWQAHGNINDVRPVDDLCKISPRPVFLIYGDQDNVLPPGTAQRMFAAACEPVETWLIHGIGHVYYRDHKTPGYEERILAFFEKGLAAPD
jgi:pimeloyl-ACP methyl ester carboxylesterase